MHKKIKNFLKRFLPTPARSTNAQMQKLEQQLEEIKALQEQHNIAITQIHNNTSEILWGEIYNNTISNSAWLHDKSSSPGRWAVGYPFLYIMYRVLNDTKPKRILELGLGESTRVIAQYAASHNGVKHKVVEQNLHWINYFKKSFSLNETTELLYLPAIETSYLDDERNLVYQDFLKSVGNEKYDLIVIDGPGVTEAKLYARIDILDLIPQNISDSFCIILDDMHLEKCYRSYLLLLNKLEETGIDYVKGRYHGAKKVAIISSLDQEFLISL